MSPGPHRAAAPPAHARRVVLHHDLGRAAFLTLACVGALLAVYGRGDEGATRPSWFALLVAVVALAAVVGWRPALVVDDAGVTLVNPLRTVRVPWAAVEDVSMGWALTVTAGGVRHRAWAAPGPRRMRSLYERRWTEGGTLERLAPALVEGAGAAGGGAWGLGDAGLVVAQRWAERVAFEPPHAPVVVAWSPSALVLAAVAVLAGVAAAVLR